MSTYRLSTGTVDNLQELVGIKGYNSNEEYSLNEVVMTVVSDSVLIYRSLSNNNTASLSDTTKWEPVELGGGGGEIGDIGFAPLGIDESLNLRRYLNGQVISQSQFVSFTNKVKAAVALFPSLSTTETNWQAEKTNSKLGQCGKFVIDDTAGTIRLPCVVNAQGLTDLQYLGTIKNESLPNISGVGGIIDNTGVLLNGAFESAGLSDDVGLTGSTGRTCTTQTFNAFRSSSTYQNGAPVQQEAVQYPYYIQVATGVEETLPAIREYQVNNSDYFGQSMYSDVAPDNASWLASNGQYNARSVYPDYYDWLNGKIGQVITANGGKVVLSTDTYTDYDFVVNQNDQTFRLPLLNGEEDWVGNTSQVLSTANIVKETPFTWTATKNGFISSTCFRDGGTQSVIAYINGQRIIFSGTATTTTTPRPGFWLKVKKGDVVSIAAENDTLTHVGITFIPAVGNGNLYYYVGDTVQDASLINAGAVLGQLSDKISRTAASDKELVVGWGMPDYSAGINITSLPYTTPSNGIVSIKVNRPDLNAIAYVNGVGIASNGLPNQSGAAISFIFPVSKDDVITASQTMNIGLFFPFKGVI